MRLFRSIGLPEQRNIGLRFLNARLKSSSSSRWLDRQNSDVYTLKARAEDYRSRAAYKLKAMDKKFHVFKRGMTVVDLGFAPGSWCQVAVEQTRPNGRVVGVDLIPIQPPEGVSTIQGNFLDPLVQKELKDMLATVNRGRANAKDLCPTKTDFSKAYADVVLSDMCGIWPQENNFWLNSINTPYRLANISGNPTRDHGMSMDMCDAALLFCITNLAENGTFICKFYTGSEDKEFEERLNRAFQRVHRVKPDASRDSSKEAYFVAQKKKAVTVDDVFY